MLRERDAEIDLVTTALAAARRGSGGTLVFSGPVGIGRSALCGEIARIAREQGARVLRAVAGSVAVPAGLLHRLFPDLDDFAALRRELLGSTGPVVVIVDDLHRADADSLRWLESLAESSASRVLLVASRMDGADGPASLGSSTCRRLDPLTADGISAVVEDLFGERGDDEFVRVCQDISAGIPLLVYALLQDLRGAGGRPCESDVELLRALRPRAVGERALAVLREQPEPVRAAARDIALLGPGLAARQHSAECAAGALAELGLVVAADAPRFVHPVLAEAVASQSDAAEAADAHRAAARSLHADDQPPEVVAEHLTCDVVRDEWEVEVLRAAGRSALRRGDEPAAIRCLRRGLLARPDRADLLTDLARAERSGDPAAAVRHIAQAVPGLDSAGQRSAALNEIPLALLGAAPPSVVDELGRLRGNDELPSDVRDAMDARYRFARLREAGWTSDTASLFRDLPQEDADPERAAVLLHAAALGGTDVDSVQAWARKVPADDAFGAVPLAAHALAMADEFGEAERRLRAVRALAPDSAATLIIDAQWSFVLMRSGRPSEAAALAERTLRRCDPELTSVVADCLVTLVWSMLDTGDLVRAAPVLSRHRSRKSPEWVRSLCAGALAAIGDEIETALAHLLECGRELDRAGWRNPCLLPWRSWVCLLQHRLGRSEAAVEVIAEDHRLAVQWGVPSGIGRALRVWGAVTDGEASIDFFRRALDVLRGTPCTLESAKTHLLLGQRLRATAPAEAAEEAGRGELLAAACGVPGLRSAVHIAANGGTHAEPTPAELRIARLVAAGFGNQRIATELAVSSRAVEKHLTRIYRKLGLAGRAELALLAASWES